MVRYQKKPEEAKDKKVTFYTKESLRCPCCDGSFKREELFGGRINVADLTDELHRKLIPTQAFGEVYPLVYDITVCPQCYYAAFKNDFGSIADKIRAPLSEEGSYRIEAVQKVFPEVDFGKPRGLIEGAASYYLSMLCYPKFTKEYAPTIKSGIASLRAAWVCNYLHSKNPNDEWDYIAKLFYGKARFLYRQAIELDQKRKEPCSMLKMLGPDTDKNYGYEGVLYLAAILELKYGQKTDIPKRKEVLQKSKYAIARMFGLGKKSKSKPGPLLDKARDLYERFKAELEEDDDSDE